MIKKSKKNLLFLKKALTRGTIFLCLFLTLLSGTSFAVDSSQQLQDYENQQQQQAASNNPQPTNDGSTYDANGNLNIANCFKKGSAGFMTFLDSVIWSDDFVDSLIEPWKDVLVRNTCQAFDILGLIQQRDKLREQIRSAYLTCRNEKIPQLKTAYYKSIVEITYVRSIVMGGWIKKTLAPIATVRKNLSDKFVDTEKWFTPSEFDIFWNELELRYAEAKSQYIDQCQMTSWNGVLKKLTAFYEYVLKGGFVDDAKKDWNKSVGSRAAKINQAWTDMTDWENGFSDMFQVNVNNGSASDFWNKFTKSFSDVNVFDPANPFNANSVGTTEEAFQTQERADYSQRQTVLYNTLSTRFYSLYIKGGDTMTEQFMTQANALNDNITGSFSTLENLQKKAESINARQCSGG